MRRLGGLRAFAGLVRLVVPAASAALGAALVESCNDSTAPRPAVTVSVTSLLGPTYAADSAGHQLIQCEITLIARSSSTQSASWMDATFAFYAPNDSRTPFAIDTIPAATIRSSWGADSIERTHDDTAQWVVSGTIPFTLTMRFSYSLSGGPVASTEVTSACRPTIPVGPPPTITTLKDQMDTAPEPGDTLHVSYTVTSSVGLWQSAVHVAGPCDVTALLPENLQHSVTHDLAVYLPAACSLGVPVSVTAEAFDLDLQQTTRSLALPALVDRRPPRIYVGVSTPYNPSAPIASFAGYVFTGDSLTLLVTAIDNHALHGFYWEVLPAGLRDSVLANDSSVFRTVTIPVTPSWVGTIQLRLYAKDALGNVSDTVSTSPGAIQVGPTVGPPPTLTSIPGDITDIAFDPKRAVIYLLQSNSYNIAVFSPASLTVVRNIALTDYAPDFDLSPSGDSIVTVLKNSQSIGIVDLTRPSPALQTIPLPSLDSTLLLNVRIANNGRALIPTQHFVLGGGKRLYTYDLATGTLRIRLDAPDLGSEAGGELERSRDRHVIIVNGMAGAFLRYDAGTDTFGAALTARILDTPPSVDSTGANVAVSGDLYDASLQYLRTVGLAKTGEGPAAISPDGLTHYMAIAPTYGQAGIVRSHVSDGSMIDHIPAPLLISFLRVSPDGSTLAVVENCCGEVRIGLINLPQLH